MSIQTENGDSNSKTSKKSSKRKSTTKWTIGPSLLVLFFASDLILVLFWSVGYTEIFEKFKAVVPVIWGALIVFLGYLGVEKATKKISLLRLFRLLPVVFVTIFLTILIWFGSIFLALILFSIHNVEIVAIYNDKPQYGITICLDGDSLGTTDNNGYLKKSYIKAGNYQLLASLGPIKNFKNVNVDWSSISTKDTIYLRPSSPSDNGSLYIKTVLSGKQISGAEIFRDGELQGVRSPGRIENLRVKSYNIEARFIQHGRTYYGQRELVEVKPLVTDTVIITLSYSSSLPSELTVIAKYEGDLISGASIILNDDTLKYLTPYKISNLSSSASYNVKLYYVKDDILYEGESNSVILVPGKNKFIEIDMEQIKHL